MQRNQTYYAATVFKIIYVKLCSWDVIALKIKLFWMQAGCPNCPNTSEPNMII